MTRLLVFLTLCAGSAFAQCTPSYDPLLGKMVCPTQNFKGNVAIGSTVISPTYGVRPPAGSNSHVAIGPNETAGLWWSNLSGSGVLEIPGVVNTRGSSNITGQVQAGFNGGNLFFDDLSDAPSRTSLGMSTGIWTEPFTASLRIGNWVNDEPAALMLGTLPDNPYTITGGHLWSYNDSQDLGGLGVQARGAASAGAWAQDVTWRGAYSGTATGAYCVKVTAVATPVASTTATFAAGSTTLTVASATGIVAGQLVWAGTRMGDVLPYSATVVSIVGSTVTINHPAVAAGSGQAVGFYSSSATDTYSWGQGDSPTCGNGGTGLSTSAAIFDPTLDQASQPMVTLSSGVKLTWSSPIGHVAGGIITNTVDHRFRNLNFTGTATGPNISATAKINTNTLQWQNGIFWPNSDSGTAIQFCRANETTCDLTYDSSSGKVSIGIPVISSLGKLQINGDGTADMYMDVNNGSDAHTTGIRIKGSPTSTANWWTLRSQNSTGTLIIGSGTLDALTVTQAGVISFIGNANFTAGNVPCFKAGGVIGYAVVTAGSVGSCN